MNKLDVSLKTFGGILFLRYISFFAIFTLYYHTKHVYGNILKQENDVK